MSSQMANFIWSICNLLRGPYKRNEYRKVILPLTVLRRFDCILAHTKEKALEEYKDIKGKSENIIAEKLKQITGVSFYNLSKLYFTNLTDDPNQIAPNLNSYINAFSPNVREIFEHFDFNDQIKRMNEKNLLFEVIKKFASPELDLSPEKIDNMQMGYIFEELIRIGAEQSNEEAGEHFTPREVIKLMVNLLLSTETELSKSHVVRTIYDPACGTGGMLSVAEQYIRDLNPAAKPLLHGQDFNDEAWAICRSDMLIKNEDAENIKAGDIFTHDGFAKETFHYMLANPPFGVEWKQQERVIKDEHERLASSGRFGPGLPRISDGSLLFLMHMISKMREPEKGGSRIAIVFNGSPLFSGDAGSGESNIRQWMIENDWLEAIIALPDQLFYNTGISTYIWVVTNRKIEQRRGKVQLIDAREFYVKMRKSLGNKRNMIADGDNSIDQISEITKIYERFTHNETVKFEVEGVEKELVSKIFDNADFGYNKITVERPLRLNFQASFKRVSRLDEIRAFQKIAESDKKNETVRQQQIAEGRERQEVIRTFLNAFAEHTGQNVFKDRRIFIKELEGFAKTSGVNLSAAEFKAILEALSEKDETAEICRDSKGNPEADTDLRDTENVPLTEDIDEYFKREVLPHVPDAWIDRNKTKVGYEIPFNRYFYRYEAPRELEAIEADIQGLESEIVRLLREVSGSGETGMKHKPYPKYKTNGVKWLNEVPDHWEIKRLKYNFLLLTNKIESPKNPIALENIESWTGRFLETETEFNGDGVAFVKDDILFGKLRPYLAKVLKAINSGEAVGDFFVLRPKKTIGPEFAAYYLRSENFINVITGATFGSKMPRVSWEFMADLSTPLPPLPEQQNIAAYLDRETAKIDALINKVETAIEKLKEYRTSLISATVTGKIDVREQN